MCKCGSPWMWAVSGTILSVLCLAIPVQSAAVGNITTAKISLSNLELNASASRNVYKTAAPQRPSQGPADNTGSAAQVGFYKVDTESTGIPGGLRAKAQRVPQEDPRSARIRVSGRSRPSADLYEEDAEEIDEEDLKGKGRGRAGSRRQPSSDEDHDLGRQRAPSRPQVGYKPFGGGEVAPTPLKKPKQDDYKSDDEESADFGEHSSSGDGGGSHGSYSSSSSGSSDDHDDYKGDSSADDDEADHHAEDSGDGAAYKEEEEEGDGHHHDVSAPSSESLKEELHDKHEAKKLADIKPVSEDDHHDSHGSVGGDNTHTSASTDAKSEDFVSEPHHHGPKSHSYVKGGEQKHKAEHHSAVGEKGSKGYKKKEAHDSAEAGKHGKEAHKVHSQTKKGHKKAHLDEAGKYAQKHEAEKAKTGAEFADKGKHKKGHSTKGFRTVHRKDEFKKDETFYDEADNQGHHAKKGAVEKHHQGKKGEKQEKKHHDSKHDVGKASKEGEKGHGKHSQAKKGHKGEEHEEAKHQSLSKTAKEGGSKAAHKSQHAKAGHDDHY